MSRDDILMVLGGVAYVGVLCALGFMAMAQGNHDAQTALIALASPGAVAAGLVSRRPVAPPAD